MFKERDDITIGANEAQSHFPEILERVERGEQITITRKGDPVARIVPLRAGASRAERRAAIDAIRRSSKGRTLGGESIRDLLREGRR